MITQELVKEYFKYKNGVLIWKIKRRSDNKGDTAGDLNGQGYFRIMLNCKRYLIHRLIFLYHHGYLPRFIDHIDGNPSNNKIENLRECSSRQNQFNSKTRKDNTSGVKGVHWKKGIKKWVAQISVNGKYKNLGSFSDIKDAESAVRKARIASHGEFANHGDSSCV